MFIVPLTQESRLPARLLDARFERFFAPLLTRDGAAQARHPALDVTESDVAYTARLDMPGVAKEAVKITVEGRRVSVEAEAASVNANDQARVVHRERMVAGYARTFMLPAAVDQDATVARLENGVLELTLPKRAPRTVAQISIS